MTGGGSARAKLTDEQAAEIRRLYATGTRSQVSLAAEFGVSQPTISTVVLQVRYREPGRA
jgi:DNA-binding transcriptional regulator LsrR (DeoR family)